jgi:chain length determinant protein (polysaccharide antigen chain regulator)
MIMNNENQNKPTAQSSDIYASSQYPTDEIDLIDIWRVLVRQRKLILIVTLIVSMLAVGYVLVTPPVYKAEVFLLPPLGKDVVGLSHPDATLTPVNIRQTPLEIKRTPKNIILSPGDIRRTTVDAVYDEMIINLQSLSLRRQFLDEQKLVQNSLSPQTLLVQRGRKEKSDFCTVSLEGSDPELITIWLNGFVSMVDSYTKNKLAEIIETEIENKKKAIGEKIGGLRQTSTNRRLDRITLLKEQFYIAEKLGIVDRKNVSGDVTTKIQNSPRIGLSVNSEGTPLYLRGTGELQAEIDMLERRKNDDPFIANLRDLQGELIRLEKIRLDRGDISAVRIDRMAVQPEEPIKPKRKRIVVLGLLLGIILGLFSAFLANFIETNRHRM